MVPGGDGTSDLPAPAHGASLRRTRGPPQQGTRCNTSASTRVGGKLHLDDLVRVADLAVIGGRALLDLVDHVHARHDLAEQGVLTGEGGASLVADEELRIGRVRGTRTGHPHRAALEW